MLGYVPDFVDNTDVIPIELFVQVIFQLFAHLLGQVFFLGLAR
jgi:hypothetical protein